MRRSVFFPLLSILVVIVALSAVPRRMAVNALKVESPMPRQVDLMTVLGGGITHDGALGRSTRERLEAVLKHADFLGKHGTILIQEYPSGEKLMRDFLLEHGIQASQLIDSGYTYHERNGGTDNNIHELLYVLNTRPGIGKVALVTSPYHQKRVQIIIRKQLNAFPKLKKTKFYFVQIPGDGEIMICSRLRFLKLIFHELFGILYQKVTP